MVLFVVNFGGTADSEKTFGQPLVLSEAPLRSANSHHSQHHRKKRIHFLDPPFTDNNNLDNGQHFQQIH